MNDSTLFLLDKLDVAVLDLVADLEVVLSRLQAFLNSLPNRYKRTNQTVESGRNPRKISNTSGEETKDGPNAARIKARLAKIGDAGLMIQLAESRAKRMNAIGTTTSVEENLQSRVACIQRIQARVAELRGEEMSEAVLQLDCPLLTYDSTRREYVVCQYWGKRRGVGGTNGP